MIDEVEEIEEGLRRIDEMINRLKEKKRELKKAMNEVIYDEVRYCVFCASTNIKGIPDELKYKYQELYNCYYCCNCGRGFRANPLMLKSLKKLKEVLSQ